MTRHDFLYILGGNEAVELASHSPHTRKAFSERVKSRRHDTLFDGSGDIMFDNIVERLRRGFVWRSKKDVEDSVRHDVCVAKMTYFEE